MASCEVRLWRNSGIIEWLTIVEAGVANLEFAFNSFQHDFVFVYLLLTRRYCLNLGKQDKEKKVLQ
jgi:hypothetical protein